MGLRDPRRLMGIFFFFGKVQRRGHISNEPERREGVQGGEDVIGIPGMAELRQVKTHGCLEEPQGAGLCVQEAEMGVVGGFECMDSMLWT